MKQESYKTESQSDNRKNNLKQHRPVDNPRKAATKLKQINNHIDTMKRRFKVLKVQDDYHRYRTIDQQKKISLHQQIHYQLQNDRQFVRKSLEKIHDPTSLKEKSDQLRSQIREGIKQARKSLMENRLDRSSLINQEFINNTMQIRDHNDKNHQQKRQKMLTVKMQEEQKRQTLSRHQQNKIKTVRFNKSIDSQHLLQNSQKGQHELSRLFQYQQQLLKKSSQSLQASQVMQHKFNQIFTKGGKYSGTRLLPDIRAKTNNSSQNTSITNSQLMIL